MQAGKLKHRITLQKEVKSKNDFNEWVTTYADWVTIWGEILPAVGSNYYASKQIDAKVDGVVKIRYREGVLPTMRIKYGNRYLSIVSIVQPQEGRRELHLMYTEGLD